MNFIPSNITWSVDSNGIFKHLKCKGVVSRDKNDNNTVKQTTVNGVPVCDPCHKLQYNQVLMQFMYRVASGDYGRTPDPLVPVNTLISRLTILRKERKDNRLQNLNNERQAEQLLRKADDNTRLLRLLGRVMCRDCQG